MQAVIKGTRTYLKEHVNISLSFLLQQGNTDKIKHFLIQELSHAVVESSVIQPDDAFEASIQRLVHAFMEKILFELDSSYLLASQGKTK